MTLYQIIDSALTCQQQRADGTMVPLLAKNRRAPMRSAVKRYAAMLGCDLTKAPPEDYHRPDHEIKALVEAQAPRTLAAATVRNLINDVLWLLRTGVDQGWLEPLPAPLLSWRTRHAYPHTGVPRTERSQNRSTYRLPIDQCPSALRDALTAYIAWCEAPLARNRDRRVAKRPVTSRKTYVCILRLAGFAVNTLHEPADGLTLKGLCQPDLIEAFINWWLTERNGRMTGGLEQYLLIPKTIARHWLKDNDLADTLNKMLHSLPPAEATMDKTQRWLTRAQLEEVGISLHPYNARRLQDYPDIQKPWYARAESLRWTALYIEFSLIIRLLIRLPMRQRCIREMELGRNLYQDHTGTWQIRFVGTELKVAARRGQPNRYEFPFPGDLVPALEEWLKDWRTKLILSPDEPHVFLNSRGHPFRVSKDICDMISRQTYRFTGVGVTPHMIRDIWATEYLEANRNDVGGVARRLGNTEAMVLRHYAHILNQNVDERAETFNQGLLSAGKPTTR